MTCFFTGMQRWTQKKASRRSDCLCGV